MAFFQNNAPMQSHPIQQQNSFGMPSMQPAPANGSSGVGFGSNIGAMQPQRGGTPSSFAPLQPQSSGYSLSPQPNMNGQRPQTQQQQPPQSTQKKDAFADLVNLMD
jgi:hypothetical protein